MSIDDDLVVVPAKPENFKRMFLRGFWSCIEISETRLSYLTYIACYQVAPVSAITHYARIDPARTKPNHAEPHKYDLFFANPTELSEPIPMGRQQFGQGRRYASLQRLRNSKTLDDLFEFNE